MDEIDPRRPPPTFQDWMLLAIGVVFVVMGLVILPHDPDVGIVTLALFGTCLVVFAATIWRKLRYRKFSAEKVEVAGGVPIRPKTVVMVGLGAWLLVLGIILVVFGQSYPAAFRVLGGFVAAVGAVLLALALSGRWPGGYLQFDPEHFTIAQRTWSARIPWDAIAAVQEADYHSNPILLIHVPELAMISVAPEDMRLKAFQAIGKSRAYMGAEFAIMTTHYGIDLPVLGATVSRYVADAAARTELQPRLA